MSKSIQQYVKVCACGCGQPVPLAQSTCNARGYKAGEPTKFIRGHAMGKYEIDRTVRAVKDLECRRRYKREQRERMKTHVLDYLSSHPCVYCGEIDPIVLDFHHRNPEEKHKTISQIVAGGLGINVLKKEIEKCDVLCANDHRRYHFNKPLRPLVGNY